MLRLIPLLQHLCPARLAAALRQASHRQHQADLQQRLADLQQRLADLLSEREALDRDIVATTCKLLRLMGNATPAEAATTISQPLPTGAEQ